MSVRILIKQTDMPSCFFITYWNSSKAYCIPGKLRHFQSSGIFKLQKNGSHYEKTNVIFRLSTPKNIKKHQEIKIKKQDQKFVAQWNKPVFLNNFRLEYLMVISNIASINSFKNHHDVSDFYKSDIAMHGLQ